MKSSTPILSWGVFGAVGAGVLFVLLSVLSLAIPKPASFLDVGLITATLLTVGCRRARAPRRAEGKLRSVGMDRSFNNHSRFGPERSRHGAHRRRQHGPRWLAFPIGLLLIFVGFVVLGIATLRARVLPRWCGLLLIAAMPLTAVVGQALGAQSDFGDYPGAVVLGLTWLALGYALRSRKAAQQQPARVG